MSRKSAIAFRRSRNARAEASVWMVRLHGESRTPELEAGFQAWLAADPENPRQFEYITEIWDFGSSVQAEGFPRLRTWGNAPLRSVGLPALATIVVILGLFAVAYWGWVRTLYITEHGEQRLVRLQDGSSVYLNSDSRLRVKFDGQTRRVRLERGEGLFEIAKDAAHPFIVEAGGREVTALGTTFMVWYETTRTAVTLVEGKVTVSGANSAAGSSARPTDVTTSAVVTLTPGERLVLAQNRAPRLDTPRIDAVTAWRRGQVLLEANTLPEAVAEMNRYDRRRLVIDDPQLNSVRVSGIFRTGDSRGFAQALAELHQLDVSEYDDTIHLRSSHPGRN